MNSPIQNLHVVRGIIVAGTISALPAATWTSNATAGANWSDADNWAGDVIPVNGDDIVIGIPAVGGTRITNNDLLTSIGNLTLQANLNEANGNAVSLNGNSVQYTAGGSSVGRIGMAITLTQNTAYTVSANTSSGRLEVGGAITGDFDLTKDGAGRLRFTGTAKAYTGDTIVTGGILDMSTNDMLPYGAGKGDVHVGTGADFFLNNVNTQINGLNDYNATAGTVTKTGSNTRSLTLGHGDANGSFSGNISFTGGSSTVNKTGAGTQTLSGAVTTAGQGTVSGGRLNINGTWSNGINVNNGATLGGTGTVGTTITINSGATLAPGMSIESLAAGAATINGTLAIEFDGTGSGTIDLLEITNLLDITNATVDFSLLGTALDDSAYVFARYGSLAGTAFANVIDLPGGYSIDYAYDNGINTNNIALVAIPEPATLGLGAFGFAVLLRRRRM